MTCPSRQDPQDPPQPRGATPDAASAAPSPTLHEPDPSITPALLRHPIQAATRVSLLCAIFGLCIAGWWQSRSTPKPSEANVQPFQIDINRASPQEWMLMPGIGPKTAQQIIQDRQRHGDFENVDALMRVRGIGEKTVQRIRPYCRSR